MAIIYTYPRVINPDGTELIVVSETKNKNATRIMYVQDIWDHFDCSHCDFCTTSISEITSPFGDTVTALACDTGINFTSSDASVTITGDNLTKTINFKAAGGGGGCPPNYVVKPSICEGTDCYVSEKLQEWVFTCDETLGAFAPGYIKDFTLNGVLVPHPSPGEGECWHIELATFAASETSCVECCDPTEVVYTFNPCHGDPNVPFSTLSTNITGLDIAWVDNDCAFLNISGVPVTDNDCWQITSGGVDGGAAVTINSAEILSDPCECPCCLFPCTFEYTACPGAPLAAPAKILIDGLTMTDPCDEASALTQIWHDYSGVGDFWCYTFNEKVCEPITAPTYGSSGFVEDCDHPTYCPPVDPTYTWENCSTSVQFTTEEEIPTAIVGKVYEYCCTDSDAPVTECFEYLGNIGQPVGGTPPCNPLISAIFVHDDCECCLYKCVYEYTACPGNPTTLPNTVYFEMPLINSEPNPCDCTAPHPNPVFTDLISGDTWCYEVGDQICVPPTDGVSFVADPHYCEDADYCPTPPEVTYTFTNCTDPGASFSTLESNITMPLGYNIGDWADILCTYATINLGVGELFCYQVTTGGVSSGIAIDITQDPVVLDPLLGDCCDCCIYPCTYEYVLPCNPDDKPDAAPVTVTVEILDCADAGVPNVVSVEYSAGEFWCYQSPVKTCVIPIDTLYASGDDCTLCDVVDYYAWKNCDDADFNYTTEDIQTLYPLLYTHLPFTGPFGNQMSTDCWDPQCCFTVEGPFPGPIPGADVPLPNDGTCDDPNNAELDQECDCCIYWDVVEYAACSEDCELEEYPLLNIDVCEWGKSLLVPQDWKWDTAPAFVKVQTPSGECCYEKRDQPCEAETLLSGAGLTYSDLDSDETWEDCTCGEVGVKLNLCDAVDPAPPIWASDTLSPGISALNVGDIVSHAGTCYEVIESPAPLLGPISNLSGFTFWDSVAPLDPCECCNLSAGTNNRQYLACVDGDPSIVINPASWSPPLTTFGIDTDIRVEYTSNPGVWHCYTYDQCISSSVTLGISDVQISTDCADSLCDLELVELTQCGGAYTETLSKTEIVTGGLVNGDVVDITGGPLSGIGTTTCWEITNINAPGPQTQVGASTYTGPIAASGIDATTACECCEQDLREYAICPDAAGTTCNAAQPLTLYIDVSSIVGYDPATYTNILAEETNPATGYRCCYTYVGTAVCQQDTGIFISLVTDCADVACSD